MHIGGGRCPETPLASSRVRQIVRAPAPFRLAHYIREGEPGFVVTPLLDLGVPAGELSTDSQRYFDIHHTRNDRIDNVNPRELQFGAAALASLIYRVDTQGR
jgi:hypothetical protein